MINTLVNLLGGFYENNDFAKVEVTSCDVGAFSEGASNGDETRAGILARAR